jgi:NAD+ synthase (glutamine-hydrolysing)
MALPGYFMGDVWEQSSFLRECERLTYELAKHTGDVLLVFGSVGLDWNKQNEDGRVRKYNAAYCARNGQLMKNPMLGYPFWIKSLSPNYRIFNESRYFFDLRKLASERNQDPSSLLAPLLVSLKYNKYRIALNICEDAWDENYSFSPIRELCKQGMDFILNLSCSPYTLAKNSKRSRIFRHYVRDLKIPMAYVNCVGTQNLGKTVFTFDGASSIYRNESSDYQAGNFKESVLVYDLHSDSCEPFSLEDKQGLIKLTPDTFGQSLISEPAEIYEALSEGLRSILQRWKITEVVIGASGGIDSALAAALYTQILGPKSVLLVNMPSRFNSPLTKNAARQLASNLGTPFAEFPIQESFESTSSQLSTLRFTPEIGHLPLSNLVLESIQARDRSARILAAIASARKSVFTCNANKTELTVGYSTLYGDAGGFLAVLGDLWKQQIYELANYVNNDIAGEELIPEASIQVVPSAELSAHQDVTQGKGDPFLYPYHDALFRSWVEHWDRKTPEDILGAVSEDSIQSILNMNRENVLGFFKNDATAFVNDLERWWFAYCGMGAVKRVQSPPVLALSRRAFGNDHQEAIGTMPLSRKYYEIKSKFLASI